MAIRNRTVNAVGYGLTDALSNLAPLPIKAQRAPVSSDTAPIGQIWIDQPADTVYVLTSITNGSANWQLLEQSGGAGSFTSLTVNPGPVTTEGTGAVSISGDAVNTTVDIATGAGVKLLSLGSNNGASATTIQSGSGNIAISTTTGNVSVDANAAGQINIGVATAADIGIGAGAAGQSISIIGGDGATALGLSASGGDIDIYAGTGSIDIASDATTSAVNVGRGNGAGSVKTVVVGCDQGASATTIASGSGNMIINSGAGTLTIESTNQTIDVNSGTGVLSISGDAAATTVNIAGGAAAKTLRLGSSTTTSSTLVTAGTGGISIAAAGLVGVTPTTPTAASPTASVTSDVNVIAATFTGFTTAAAGTQAFTITSSMILATSGIFVTVCNASAGNDAKMTLTSVTQAVGSIVVNTTNNGTQALDSTVYVNVWVIN